MRTLFCFLFLLLLLASSGCVHEDVNECAGPTPPAFCACDADEPPDYCGGEGEGEGEGDAGGEGEGEGEVDGGGEGEGEGECAQTCEAPRVCDPEDACVVCYDDGDGAPHAGCTDPLDVCAGGECVDCVDDGGDGPHPGCGGGTAFCVGGACAGCRSEGDCGVGDAIFCDPEDRTCRGCEDDAECEGRGLGAACLEPEGRCVQCDDAADCAGAGCDPRTNLCSSHGTDTVSQCGACESDDDCAGGRVCVVVQPEDAEVGTYCTFECDPAEPTDCLLNVGASGYACVAGTTRGGEAVDACVPARTTCEGWDHANTRERCQLSTECGAEGFDDGLCTDDICTYACGGDPECPPGQPICSGVCR